MQLREFFYPQSVIGACMDFLLCRGEKFAEYGE